MEKLKNITLTIGKYIIGCIILLIYGFLMLFGSALPVHAYDDTSIVMHELNNTTSFNADDEEWSKPLKVYNDKEDNFVEYPYGFKLVSIGFDDKRELYIYTCNPKADEKELTATSINIFFDTDDSEDLGENKGNNYKLELVSRSGKFDKYYVVGFNDYTHSNEYIDRYLSFISIFRTYDETIDNGLEIGITNEVAFPIGEKWSVKEINGYISYKKAFINYVEITPTISSYGTYSSGFSLNTFLNRKDRCDAWFFAFNVDNYVVENILSANLKYDIDYGYEYKVIVPTDTALSKKDYIYSSLTDQKTTITNEEQGSYEPTGWFDRKAYTWDRICKPSDFIACVENYTGSFDEKHLEALSKSEWVFSYLETPNELKTYSEQVMGVGVNTYQEIKRAYVKNVSVLSIKFIDTTGKVYNLGVVSDKFTSEINGSFLVDANKDNWNRLFDNFSKIGSIIGLILILVLVCTFASIFTPIINLLKLIFKSITYVITLPFRLIKWVFGKK